MYFYQFPHLFRSFDAIISEDVMSHLADLTTFSVTATRVRASLNAATEKYIIISL